MRGRTPNKNWTKLPSPQKIRGVGKKRRPFGKNAAVETGRQEECGGARVKKAPAPKMLTMALKKKAMPPRKLI